MNNSNQNNLITSSISISNGGTGTSSSPYTITIDPSAVSSSVVLSTGAINSSYTIGTGIDTINITDILSGWGQEPFEDSFPNWDDFQKMCEEYPGLQTAYEHLKVFYKLTIDDWESKKKGEGNV